METTSVLSYFILDPSYDHLAKTGHCILFLALVVFKNVSDELAMKPALLVSMMWKTQLQTCPVQLSHDFLIWGCCSLRWPEWFWGVLSLIHHSCMQLISYSSFRGGWQLFHLKPIPSAYLSFTGHTLLSVQNTKFSDHVFSLCIEAMRCT
jgi:hypothetical protein